MPTDSQSLDTERLLRRRRRGGVAPAPTPAPAPVPGLGEARMCCFSSSVYLEAAGREGPAPAPAAPPAAEGPRGGRAASPCAAGPGPSVRPLARRRDGDVAAACLRPLPLPPTPPLPSAAPPSDLPRPPPAAAAPASLPPRAVPAAAAAAGASWPRSGLPHLSHVSNRSLPGSAPSISKSRSRVSW